MCRITTRTHVSGCSLALGMERDKWFKLRLGGHKASTMTHLWDGHPEAFMKGAFEGWEILRWLLTRAVSSHLFSVSSSLLPFQDTVDCADYLASIPNPSSLVWVLQTPAFPWCIFLTMAIVLVVLQNRLSLQPLLTSPGWLGPLECHDPKKQRLLPNIILLPPPSLLRSSPSQRHTQQLLKRRFH